MRSPILAAIAGVAIAATPFMAQAAGYPEHSVKIIVPYAAGGAVDVVARKIAQKLTEQTRQTFYVENKPGATGTIGTSLVAHSRPDGYTLLAIDNTYSVLPYVFKELPWDHEKDIVPITASVFVPVVLAVGSQSPYKDMKGLVLEAKSHPGKLTYGSGGVGSSVHFASALFEQDAKVELTHVPYKGAGEAVTALISNQIDMLLVSTPSIRGQVKAGTARALAVSGDTRVDSLPNVPTFAEAGLPQFNVTNWSGLAAPAGTPQAVIDKIQGEVKRALASDDMKAFLNAMSAKPGGNSPAEFAALIHKETRSWADVAKAAKLSAR